MTEETASAEGSYWAPLLLGGVGLGALGVGVYFHAQRENHAQVWNSVGCEHPGSTRGDQCGNVNMRRRHAEQLAVGFYASGAALLTVAGVVLVSASSEALPSALACGAGFLSVGCSGRF
jgi:drug/metabolite transporter (DMT)-like permease